MTNLQLMTAQRLIFIGAHADDIEIGCGGFLLKNASLINERGISVEWIVGSGAGTEREGEARAGFKAFTGGIEKAQFAIHDWPDGLMLTERKGVKEYLAQLTRPDVVFTHYLDDRHQDHKFLAEMSHNAFRSAFVLEYEIIKYDWDLGNPTHFVELDEPTLQQKTNLLSACFGSQRNKAWFDEETFVGLARIRGIQCGGRYAEGFYARKNIITL